MQETIPRISRITGHTSIEDIDQYMLRVWPHISVELEHVHGTRALYRTVSMAEFLSMASMTINCRDTCIAAEAEKREKKNLGRYVNRYIPLLEGVEFYLNRAYVGEMHYRVLGINGRNPNKRGEK